MNPTIKIPFPHKIVPIRPYMASLTALLVCFCASASSATSVDAISFLSVQHGFTVQNGFSPDGITNVTSGPAISSERASMIDAVDATTDVDINDVTVGCSACSEPTPFTRFSRFRSTRTDPTEFAESQFDISALSDQDDGSDVSNFAIATRDVSRTGLAQARITSSPAAASAQSAFALSRTTTFENITNERIAFFIGGYFDAFLLSRYTGNDGFARTTTPLALTISGIGQSNLTYFSPSEYQENVSEIGTNATATEGFSSLGDGVLGMQFTSAATALGGAGLSEAAVSAEHDFLIILALDPGQSADMFFGFSQRNEVGFTPVANPPAVPLPASAWLLMLGLGGLAGLRHRRGSREST